MEFINLLDCQYNVLLRITPFLELNGMNPDNVSAKNAILPKVSDKSIAETCKIPSETHSGRFDLGFRTISGYCRLQIMVMK